MKKFIKQLFNKKTKTKIMVGKKVKLIETPCGKKSSNNTNIKHQNVFIIVSKYGENAWNINHLSGTTAGWVYEWEMEGYVLGIKELEQELAETIAETKTKLESIQSKINWINETGSTEFSEDEFKVYQTLKLLDDSKLSIIEKSKLIAELIKK